MLPAQQSLDRDIASAGHGALGVVREGELARVERAAQIVVQRVELLDAAIHLVREEAVAAFAGVLRVVHRHVGLRSSSVAVEPSSGNIAMPMLALTND